LRENLFDSAVNALITIFSLVLIILAVRGIAIWVFETADWRPVTISPLLYLVGQYPREELWRIGTSLLLVSFLFGLSWGVWQGVMRSFAILIAVSSSLIGVLPAGEAPFPDIFRYLLLLGPVVTGAGYFLGRLERVKGQHVLIGWLLSLVFSPVLWKGFGPGGILPSVQTSQWGGLLVTLLLAVGGILLSFPIGVLLALGRRSTLPVVKVFCVLVIELVRGVPLVSILFMSSIILALFLPPNLRIDRLIRALLGMTIFSAAYTAENVRGGLQAIPQGQYDAAKAVGFNNLQTLVFIVLPQALRAVIPAIVGQFISLFKDTTLAVIVGIIELLNIGKSIINSDPEFIQLQAEVYIFIALVFWVFSYLMSFASRRLETSLGVGER
jgi:general L-amino acid transport system permease protein